MTDAGVGDGAPFHNVYHHPSLPLSLPPVMPPRSRLGSTGGVRLRGPLMQSLSAVEPEPDCNGHDYFIAFALVFMLAFISLKKFHRLQKPQGMQEPLMNA
eukprot:gnl/MRDRNA2_/MRDRNA2_101409_c0_seq1.p1 gnl/MRDRNA2_/MRDRNA2_101409_c0~~gnl/MRDRNA2_/MRDRNA2_101409_c0_seq1.p1  ORF type:complete len:100 (-),score=17.84 gnl/MRDRNA2_/MRDRNA2_101409_c0_seq1:191-490(-)